MPTSNGNSITPILNEICRLQPKSVLDLGIGYGKYGSLCREYLDIAAGRLNPRDFQTALIGVEGFPEYSNGNWDNYNTVYIEDFADKEKWEHYRGFDLVLMIDSLEHLDKAQGVELLTYLLKHNRQVIVSVPDGDYPQGAVHGNSFECHRARWYAYEFKMLAQYCRIIHSGVCLAVSMVGGQVE